MAGGGGMAGGGMAGGGMAGGGAAGGGMAGGVAKGGMGAGAKGDIAGAKGGMAGAKGTAGAGAKGGMAGAGAKGTAGAKGGTVGKGGGTARARVARWQGRRRGRRGGGAVNVNVHGTSVRPWVQRPYFGTVVGGVALGSVIAATAAPAPPAENLCWIWTSAEQTQGYWDYCTPP